MWKNENRKHMKVKRGNASARSNGKVGKSYETWKNEAKKCGKIKQRKYMKAKKENVSTRWKGKDGKS